jgi:hypothetical protein
MERQRNYFPYMQKHAVQGVTNFPSFRKIQAEPFLKMAI